MLTQVPSLPSRLCFLAAAALCILIFIGHSVVLMQPPGTPLDDTHAQLLKLADTYPLPLPVPGRTRTMTEITTGFSWHYGFSYLVMGIAAITLYRRARHDASLLRTLCFLGIGACTIYASISFRFFFAFPTGSAITMLVLLALAALFSLRGSPSTKPAA